MGSHSVICHSTVVTLSPLLQLKLVLDFTTPEGCKAELSRLVIITEDSLPANETISVITGQCYQLKSTQV